VVKQFAVEVEMKAATVILLLAALVCSAICDPDRPDDKQTAEPEGYGYGVSFPAQDRLYRSRHHEAFA
jgi:hypothetical protein